MKPQSLQPFTQKLKDFGVIVYDEWFEHQNLLMFKLTGVYCCMYTGDMRDDIYITNIGELYDNDGNFLRYHLIPASEEFDEIEAFPIEIEDQLRFFREIKI